MVGRVAPKRRSRWRAVKRAAAVVVVILLILGLIFQNQVANGERTLVLIAQVFPQVPVKPLNWVTQAPRHESVSFGSREGPITADLWLPRPWFGAGTHSESAIIIAQGVKVPHGSRSSFVALGQALARLGFVVLFPQSRAVATGGQTPAGGLEEPSTYVRAFTYLERIPEVNPRRISFLGISVGSSIALVAASEPRIRRKIRALVFFAGYYNLVDYLVAISTKKDSYHGREVSWNPSTGSNGAIRQTKKILIDKGGKRLLSIFRTSTPASAKSIIRRNPTLLRGLQEYNPANHVRDFLAPTFILDDWGDRFVPYVESQKLEHALPPTQIKGFLLSRAFQHVSPGPGGLTRLAGGFLGIFGFIEQVLGYL